MPAIGILRMLTLLSILTMGPVFYALSQTSLPGNGQDPAYRLSVNVNLVVLHATVRDRKGRFAAGLRQQDFEVYENGVPQTIRLFQHEDIPVTVGLVVDHSGSMQPKLQQVTAAARGFVRFSNPEDQMFVVNFNETVTMGLPVTIPFSNDSATLADAIWGAPAFGETALYDALIKALARLQEGRWDKKVLLVISDGGDNASAHRLAQVTGFAGHSSAIIYSIGLFDRGDPDRNPRVLHHLAEATGGEAFFPRELGEVTDICERIAREIRNQYTIGYVPAAGPRIGAYRTIRVVARAADRSRLVVRTRTSYIPGGEAPDQGGVPK